MHAPSYAKSITIVVGFRVAIATGACISSFLQRVDSSMDPLSTSSATGETTGCLLARCDSSETRKKVGKEGGRNTAGPTHQVAWDQLVRI